MVFHVRYESIAAHEVQNSLIQNFKTYLLFVNKLRNWLNEMLSNLFSLQSEDICMTFNFLKSVKSEFIAYIMETQIYVF